MSAQNSEAKHSRSGRLGGSVAARMAGYPTINPGDWRLVGALQKAAKPSPLGFTKREMSALVSEPIGTVIDRIFRLVAAGLLVAHHAMEPKGGVAPSRYELVAQRRQRCSIAADIVGWAWSVTVGDHIAKAVLICLALNADSSGKCSLTCDEISDLVEVPLTTILDALDLLQKCGLVDGADGVAASEGSNITIKRREGQRS